LLVDKVAMPAYTRHDASVSVPGVVNRPVEEASQILQRRDLQVERQRAQQYNPNVPRGEVLDQQPPANALVKPGRRIYLTVNAGQTPMVLMPDLGGTSIREAKNQLLALGLSPGQVRPDPVPAPYPNTITKQSPAPGDSVREGASVNLWYSQGLGNENTEVPDVRGLRVPVAQRTLLDSNLRSIVVDTTQDADLSNVQVRMQSRAPNTSVREGTEVRLFVNADTTATDTLQLRNERME
jgi:beta-lactam-binding protein with PASTA domain